jgi:hypothetical protein
MIAPKLFEFIDRAQAGLPEHFLSATKGVLVAGPDLIGRLDDFSGSEHTWKPSLHGDGFGHDLPESNCCLLVDRLGEFWYVSRLIVGEHNFGPQVLVVAFDNVPICTRTSDEAIRLAEHCHPIPRSPMAGCWVKNYL